MTTATVRTMAVFLGGALGTLARWGIGQLAPAAGSGFPTATFVANVSGAFALALASGALFERAAAGYIRHFLGVGLLGAYTTFSTLAIEGVRLIEAGAWRVAALYWGATFLVGQAAGVYGLWLGRRASTRRGDRGASR